MAMSDYCDGYREFTDYEFIHAVLSGDKGAEGCFSEIYIDGPVRSIVFKKYYWLKADVEDICQEIWLYLKSRHWKILNNFKNLPAGPEAPKLYSYLCGAVSRLIVKQYRNKFAHFLVPLIFDNEEEMEIPTLGTDQIFEREDAQKRAENLVEMLFSEILTPGSKAGLNDAEQKIFRMRCIMQPSLSSREVGNLLGMKPGAVDTALSRAKKKIRNFYEAKGLLEDAMEVLRDAADL